MSWDSCEVSKLIGELTEAWKQYEANRVNQKPDWRKFLVPGRPMLPDQLLNVCLEDIAWRLWLKEPPPLSEAYLESDEAPGLKQDDFFFELIKFEYEWCWRHYVGVEATSDYLTRPLTKGEYLLRFDRLKTQIESLKTRWECIRCRQWTHGDEEDDPPCCQHCGYGVDQTVLDLPRPLTGTGPILQELTIDPDNPPPFERLGLYRLGRQLGKGGMGVVWEGQHIHTKHRVAIKLMDSKFADRDDSRPRFLQEIQHAARIPRNNHVVPFVFSDEDKEAIYFVMPLLDGETLQQRLERDKKMAAKDVEKLGREAALGLETIHQAGVIHRDVKPGNIWLEQPQQGGAWQIVLLDFGNACAADRTDALPRSGGITGTPAYMAPEQANGEPEYRSDLFSLGCVMYQAATGEQPFPGNTYPEIFAAMANVTPKPPHEIEPTFPLSLSKLIMDLLKKDPKERPASAAIVTQRLSRADVEPPPNKEVSKTKMSLVFLFLLFLAMQGSFFHALSSRMIPSASRPSEEVAPRTSLEEIHKRNLPAQLFSMSKLTETDGTSIWIDVRTSKEQCLRTYEEFRFDLNRKASETFRDGVLFLTCANDATVYQWPAELKPLNDSPTGRSLLQLTHNRLTASPLPPQVESDVILAVVVLSSTTLKEEERVRLEKQIKDLDNGNIPRFKTITLEYIDGLLQTDTLLMKKMMEKGIRHEKTVAPSRSFGDELKQLTKGKPHLHSHAFIIMQHD